MTGVDALKLDTTALPSALDDAAAMPARGLKSAMARGARGLCPQCGNGKLFSRFLAVEANCPSCGEALFHHRADDLPVYLNIFLTGHVVVGVMMLVMDHEFMPMWSLTLLTAAIAVAASLLLMRPLKGLVIGAQWALLMHGFGGHDD